MITKMLTRLKRKELSENFKKEIENLKKKKI